MNHSYVFEAFPVRRPSWRERRPGYSVGQDERIITPLLSLILNQYSAGDDIPRTGVPLVWRMCRRYGMKRAGWQALREFVYPRRGYLTRGPGGKLTVVLAHHRAAGFVLAARRAGRIGGIPHLLGEGVAFDSRGSSTRQHTGAALQGGI